MADSTLKVNVVTTADTAGITDTAGELKNLQDVANRTGETLAQVQARFAEGPKFVQALTQEATKTAAAFTVTRTEAAALATELINGNISARSIGTSLSGFGNSFAVAGVAALVVFEAIDKIAAGILKSNEEAAKFETTLRKDVEQWAQMAKYATSLGDVVNLSSKVSQELDKMASDMEKFRQTQLGFWQKFWDAIAQGSFVLGLPTFSGAKADEAKKKQEELNRAVQAGNTEVTEAERKYGDYANAVAHLSEGIREYGQRASDLAVSLKELDAQALADPTNLSIQKKRAQTLKDLQETDKVYHELVADQERLNDAAKKEDHKQARDDLRQLETAIQSIRQNQQLIQSSPFMGADAKQTALVQSYATEMQKIQASIEAINRDRAKGIIDQEQANQKLQQANFQVQLLGQKISAATHPLQSELQTWANSFGTTMQQLGKTIEQTVGVALQSLNQFLVTGKFNAQALLQQIATLGLQLVEQMIIQRVMATINAGAAATQAAVTGPAIAAAFAPAATAVTVATEGQAALTAPASFATALALIEGMVFAQHGGFIPGTGTEDTVPAMLAPGEFVINRASAQAIGYGNLEELNMMAAGGVVHMGRHHYQEAVYPDTPPRGMGPWWSDTGLDPSSARYLDSFFNSGLLNLFNPGFFPPSGTPGSWQGPTMIPTTFDPAGYPMAVPATDYPSSQAIHAYGGHFAPHQRGGLIRRFQAGGAVTGGRGGGVHIYAFTDLKALTKHMGSREGQKIIFDTVKGRRIDLGIS